MSEASSLPLNEDKVLANNIKIGPWGYSGESNFDFGRSSSRIIKVQIYSGGVIDSLKICCVVDENIVTTYQAGGPGGSLQEFELLPGEYINSMVGYIGAYNGESCISELKFTTNFGNSKTFGEGGGTKFTVPVIEGQIVGFFGQFTNYINGIGAYLAS